MPPPDIFSVTGHPDNPIDMAVEAATLAALSLLVFYLDSIPDIVLMVSSTGGVPSGSLLIACHLLKVKHSVMTPEPCRQYR